MNYQKQLLTLFEFLHTMEYTKEKRNPQKIYIRNSLEIQKEELCLTICSVVAVMIMTVAVADLIILVVETALGSLS